MKFALIVYGFQFQSNVKSSAKNARFLKYFCFMISISLPNSILDSRQSRNEEQSSELSLPIDLIRSMSRRVSKILV